jgi:leader peptidase (prepilin peptidase) / N-methyltransferase
MAEITFMLGSNFEMEFAMFDSIASLYHAFVASADLLPMWYWYGAVGILGLLVGSFLNVVILRMPPRMMFEWRTEAASILEGELKEGFVLGNPPVGLAIDRSRCPKCQFQLKWYHNVPVFSWVFLGGKCANCKTPISKQYPFVELLTAAASVVCLWRFGPGFSCVMALIFTWLLVAMSGIDLHTQLLPDQLTLPLLWIGLFLAMWALYVPLEPALIGAMIGYGSLWSVNALFKLVRGIDGMGNGDFKLLAALGAWMGWTKLPMIILLSASVGAAVGISLMLLRKQEREQPMPFGPFLAAAGWSAFVFGDVLMRQYWLVVGMPAA